MPMQFSKLAPKVRHLGVGIDVTEVLETPKISLKKRRRKLTNPTPQAKTPIQSPRKRTRRLMLTARQALEVSQMPLNSPRQRSPLAIPRRSVLRLIPLSLSPRSMDIHTR